MNPTFNFYIAQAKSEANRATALPPEKRETALGHALLNARRARSIAEDRGAGEHAKEAADVHRDILRTVG